jgi:4-amino-4-deoxy-L-arabinose transferase-like glycosyltransferase
MQVFITFLLNAVLFKTVLRLFGRVSLASLTILVANTTYVVYKNTYSLTLEPIVTLFIALSLLMFIEYLESGKARCAYLWAVFSGMAVMSKGIIGFAAFFVVLLFMILFERRLLKNHFFKVFVPSALIFTATFAWWYVYVGVRTDFFVHFFRLEFLDRLMNGLFHDPAASSGYTERPVYQYVVDLFKYHFLYIIPLAYGAYRLSGEIKRNKGLMLIAFVVLSDFVLIHFVSTRVLRYLYQPLFFASIFTAYGIECLFKADYRKFMIYASCLYFVVTSFVPHGYNKWNAYGWLQELNTLAKESSSPVVASFPDPKDEEHRAAVDYFIESYQENEPQSGCFYKVADKNSPENMMLLKTTRRLKIGVKCSGEAILLK